jgi:hypothetical protein
MPANSARQPATATTGIMLAVWGNDVRVRCADCAVVPAGLASIRAGIVALAIDTLDDAISPCWLVPPGVEAACAASALTFVS